MPFAISFVDDPDVFEKKKQARPIHIDYVLSNAHRIITSGGYFPDDDDFPNGGLILAGRRHPGRGGGLYRKRPLLQNRRVQHL